jgi:sugar phosphate permease
MFEGGASIVISVILCDLGKDEVLKRKRKAVSTISGINDGIAGFGGILGQLLLGPVQRWKGWTGAFVMFSAGAILACLPTIPYVYREVSNYCRQPAPEKKSE